MPRDLAATKSLTELKNRTFQLMAERHNPLPTPAYLFTHGTGAPRYHCTEDCVLTDLASNQVVAYIDPQGCVRGIADGVARFYLSQDQVHFCEYGSGDAKFYFERPWRPASRSPSQSEEVRRMLTERTPK
jgi:hypothetical protein